MVKAKVCTSCGGVALPPEAEHAEKCTTPGCQKEGQPLEVQDVTPEETSTCPACGGTFLESAGHRH